MQTPRLAALILLILAALTAGCSRSAPTSAPAQRPRPAEGPSRQVEIQVQGTAGVRFEGSLGEPGGDPDDHRDSPGPVQTAGARERLRAGEEGRPGGQDRGPRADGPARGRITLHR